MIEEINKFLLLFIIGCVFIIVPCPWLYFTGFTCPGCGLGRALLALLQGDFVISFKYHALLIPMLIALAIYAVDYDSLKHKIANCYFALLGIMMFVYYCFRNFNNLIIF